jgi:hypothetical protein
VVADYLVTRLSSGNGTLYSPHNLCERLEAVLTDLVAGSVIGPSTRETYLDVTIGGNLEEPLSNCTSKQLYPKQLYPFEGFTFDARRVLLLVVRPTF